MSQRMLSSIGRSTEQIILFAKMTKPLTRPAKNSAIVIALSITVALFLSCVSENAANLRPDGTRHITDLVIWENTESLTLTIEGDRSLTYTETSQPLQKRVLLKFPDTRLAIVAQTYVPPDNDIISAIQVDETSEAQTTTSSISIVLKRDATHDVKSDEAGLQVSFLKVAGAAAGIRPQNRSAGKNTEPKLSRENAQAAAELITVLVSGSNDCLVVQVKADEPIRDYKTFVIDNPPRIVFDMFKLRSPYNRQQVISVTSKWAKRIRHFGYPDKVRLVIETQSNYLSNYSALPNETGLTIYVGRTSAANIASESKPD